jgi:hypothetical protein
VSVPTISTDKVIESTPSQQVKREKRITLARAGIPSGHEPKTESTHDNRTNKETKKENCRSKAVKDKEVKQVRKVTQHNRGRVSKLEAINLGARTSGQRS